MDCPCRDARSEALAFLARARRPRWCWAWSGCSAALAALGHPERRLPARARGAAPTARGSTCAFARGRACAPPGYRVGLYTSPHLVRFNERIRLQRRGHLRRDARHRGIVEVLRKAPAADGARRTSSSARWWRFWHFAQRGGGGRGAGDGPRRPAGCDHRRRPAGDRGHPRGARPHGVPGRHPGGHRAGEGRHPPPGRARGGGASRRPEVLRHHRGPARLGRRTAAASRAATSALATGRPVPDATELSLDGLALGPARRPPAPQRRGGRCACARRSSSARGAGLGARPSGPGCARRAGRGGSRRWPGSRRSFSTARTTEEAVEALVAALDAVPYAGRPHPPRVRRGVGQGRGADAPDALAPRAPRPPSLRVPTPAQPVPRAPTLSLAQSLSPLVDVAASPEAALAPGAAPGGPRTTWVLVAGSLYLVGAVKALLEQTP